MLVTGEAGIGKTRLAAHALGQADSPSYGGAARSSVAEPYDPVAQVLRECLRRAPGVAGGLRAARAVPRAAAARARAAAPRTRARRRSSRRCAARSPSRARAARSRSCSTTSTGPTRPRSLLLPQLAGGLRDVPLLLVAIARDEVPADTHRLRRLRAQLRRVMRPARAAAAAARPRGHRAARRRGGRRGARRRRRRRSPRAHARHPVLRRGAGGHARAATAGAMPSGAARCPRRVLDAVLLRTEALSLPARNALERAAVVGQRCDVEHVRGARRATRWPRRWPPGSSSTRGPAHVEFRHALVRDADLPGDPVDAPPLAARGVARLLERAGAPAAERAAALARGGRRRARARCARRGRRASASVYAYRDAAELYERALDLDGGTEPLRFELLERLARARSCAGDLAGSARAWREVIDGRRGRGEVERVAEAEHAIGRVLALRGSTERALAAWSAAADAFAACGRHEDAARSRIAAAHALQVGGNLQPGARRRRGGARRPPARRAARAALARALARGHAARQAGRDRRRRSRRCTRRWRKRSRPATRRRPPPPTRRSRSCTRTPATSARRRRPTRSRSTTARAPASPATGAVCSACLCHVLRQRGEWRRSLALGRTLLEDPSVDEESRAIAAAVMSQIHAQPRRAPARAPARAWRPRPSLRQLRVLGAEMECSWTFARLELLEGSDEAALEHCRDVLRRWEESEDLPLQPERAGLVGGRLRRHAGRTRTCNRVVRALAAIAAEQRQPRGARDARRRARRARARRGRRGGRGRALPAGDRPAPRDRAAARPRRAARQRRRRRARRRPRRAGPRVARRRAPAGAPARRPPAAGGGRARRSPSSAAAGAGSAPPPA